MGPVDDGDHTRLAAGWARVVDRLGWGRTVAWVLGAVVLALPLAAIQRLPHIAALIGGWAYFIGWVLVIALYARWLKNPARG